MRGGESRILNILIKHLIKSDGKMGKTILRNEEEIKEKLAEDVIKFKNGEVSTIYLPQAWPLKGFGGLEVIVSDRVSPEEIYARIEALILEISELSEPIFTNIEVIKKCVRIAKDIFNDETKALDFVRKYLSINKVLLKEILCVLAMETKIIGTIQGIESLIISDSDLYKEAYINCRKIPIGKNKSDTIAKRVQGIARFYDNLLIITGAASHEPRTLEELKFGKGRRVPYTLLSTPFTSALCHVLEHPSQVKDYIKAYQGFIECIVINFINERNFEVAVSSGIDYLSKFKYINVSSEEKVIRMSTAILWNLLNSLIR